MKIVESVSERMQASLLAAVSLFSGAGGLPAQNPGGSSPLEPWRTQTPNSTAAPRGKEPTLDDIVAATTGARPEPVGGTWRNADNSTPTPDEFFRRLVARNSTSRDEGWGNQPGQVPSPGCYAEDPLAGVTFGTGGTPFGFGGGNIGNSTLTPPDWFRPPGQTYRTLWGDGCGNQPAYWNTLLWGGAGSGEEGSSGAQVSAAAGIEFIDTLFAAGLPSFPQSTLTPTETVRDWSAHSFSSITDLFPPPDGCPSLKDMQLPVIESPAQQAALERRLRKSRAEFVGHDGQCAEPTFSYESRADMMLSRFSVGQRPDGAITVRSTHVPNDLSLYVVDGGIDVGGGWRRTEDKTTNVFTGIKAGYSVTSRASMCGEVIYESGFSTRLCFEVAGPGGAAELRAGGFDDRSGVKAALYAQLTSYGAQLAVATPPRETESVWTREEFSVGVQSVYGLGGSVSMFKNGQWQFESKFSPGGWGFGGGFEISTDKWWDENK